MFIITKKVHRGRLAVSAILLVLTIAVLGAGLGLTQNIQAAEGADRLVHHGLHLGAISMSTTSCGTLRPIWRASAGWWPTSQPPWKKF